MLQINDLETGIELDRAAMESLNGGVSLTRIGGFRKHLYTRRRLGEHNGAAGFYTHKVYQNWIKYRVKGGRRDGKTILKKGGSLVFSTFRYL